TMAALLAGVPLALGSGTGSELRRPLGIAIVGGLIFSQLLTLYTTPVVYLAFDRLAKRVGVRLKPDTTQVVPGGSAASSEVRLKPHATQVVHGGSEASGGVRLQPDQSDGVGPPPDQPDHS